MLMARRVVFALAAALASSASAPPDAAALSDALTALIEAERGAPFWAVDANETRFASARELWAAEPPRPLRDASREFWRARDATVEGVTGIEWQRTTPLDAAFSLAFLRRVLAARGAAHGGGGAAAARCLSVGAGIGREALAVLLPAGCAAIDLLEPQAHLLAVATAALPAHARGAAFNAGLEDFDFSGVRYDVIFVGWCTDYVADADLAAFFGRAAAALAPGGAIVVKDNVSEFADAVLAPAGAHVVRSGAYLRALARVGAPDLRQLADEAQAPWVDGLFPLHAIAWVRAEESGWAWPRDEAAVGADGALASGRE